MTVSGTCLPITKSLKSEGGISNSITSVQKDCLIIEIYEETKDKNSE